LRIISKAAEGTSGSYGLTVNMKDSLNQAIIGTQTFTVNINSASLVLDIPSTDTYTSVFNLNLNEATSLFSESTSTDLIKGQISIIRFKLVVNEEKTLKLNFQISSSLTNDQFELQKFYTSYSGSNMPCTIKSQGDLYVGGSVYNSYSEIGVIASRTYEYPSELINDTIYIDAHVLIPENSTIPDDSTARFTVVTFDDANMEIMELEAQTPLLNVKANSFINKDLTQSMIVN
jgi:hypothetical protein